MGIEKIEPVIIEYRTFEEERLPDISIYYVFKGRKRGTSRGFKVDLGRFARKMGERIYPTGSKMFRRESRFLEYLRANEIQGIFITLVEGVSFLEASQVTAEVHGKELFKRYSLLGRLGIKKLVGEE